MTSTEAWVVHTDQAVFSAFDFDLAAAERLLPPGVEPVRLGEGRGRLLVNVLRLLMEPLGIPAAWNLDVAVEVVPDESCEPVDRAAFEVRLASDSVAYLDILLGEGHDVYTPRNLTVHGAREGENLRVEDEAGDLLMATGPLGGVDRRTVRRVGQKLSVREGNVYRRNYHFQGEASMDSFGRGDSDKALEAHPFADGLELGAMGPCHERMVLAPGGVGVLTYAEKRPYERRG